jgi:hypothetical protein
LAGNGPEQCGNLVFTGHSAYWINSNNKFQARLYQEADCKGYHNDGKYEEFNKAENEGQCYGSAVFVKGPSSFKSFQVLAA